MRLESGFMHKIKSKLVLITVAALTMIIHEGACQQYPIFTQYMFNGLAINPAYSGSHESMAFTAASRAQWADVKGAPRTELFTVHSPLKYSRSAAGAMLAMDRVGETQQFMFYGTYAYRFPVSEKGKLAVGGQLGITYYQTNYADLNIITQNGNEDPAFAENNHRTLPNAGIGVYYYDSKLHLGISTPSLFGNKLNKDNVLALARQKRHYFITAAYVFDLNPNLKLKPNLLIKWVESGAFQFDLNTNLLINQMAWVGASYRLNDSMDLLLGWIVKKQLAIGYSFGYPVNGLGSIRTSTHELSINYRLVKNRNIIQSPRYF